MKHIKYFISGLDQKAADEQAKDVNFYIKGLEDASISIASYVSDTHLVTKITFESKPIKKPNNNYYQKKTKVERTIDTSLVAEDQDLF